MNTQSLILDLSKKHMPNQIVRIAQGDVNGTTIAATIMNNGVLENLSGKSASFHIMNPDGGYYEDTSCTVSGNVVSYVVDEEHVAMAAGYTDDAYFTIRSGSKKCSTSRFRIKIERDASYDADPEHSYSSGITEATSNANAAAQRANSLADAFGGPISIARIHQITGM